MKPSALLLTGSLALNLGLLALLALQPQLAPAALRAVVSRSSAERATAPASTAAHPPAPAPRKLWPSLATDDLPTLVARLRAMGFPAAVIREVIRAEVAARYTSRIRALTDPDPNLPFWQLPSQVIGLNRKRIEEARALELERSKLLRSLLSDEFFATGDVTAAQRRQFGNLSKHKIDLVQRIEEDYAEMSSAIRAGMNGITLPEDREKLGLLEREKRADLAAILAPEELADYEVRSSPITSLLRNQLGNFRPTEAEFRGIYQAQKTFSDQSAGTSAGAIAGQRSAHQQLNEQIRAALGEARAAEYFRETSSEFQSLSRSAQRANLPPETVLRAYQVRDTVARESNHIYDDPALTHDQKREALRTLAQASRSQLVSILGPVAGPAYVKIADGQWLAGLERGAAVTFDGGPNLTMSNGSGSISLGTSPSYRNLPQPRPNP